MQQSELDWATIEKLLKELIEMQHNKVLECGRNIVPHLTADDILQPNDFNQLEYNPIFRYEEGVLAGIQTVHMALRALNPKIIR